MTAPGQRATRSGGRSARVRAAVHAAVTSLLAESGGGQVTIAEVAARSGVNPASIYRRWGGLQALLLDIAVARVEQDSPLPDTGTLRGDLFAYATQAAAEISRPDGLSLLRAVIGVPGGPSDDSSSGGLVRGTYLESRGAQIQRMLDRADGRDEPALHYTHVLDLILAPIYLRQLFGIAGVDRTYLESLVDRAIAG